MWNPNMSSGKVNLEGWQATGGFPGVNVQRRPRNFNKVIKNVQVNLETGVCLIPQLEVKSSGFSLQQQLYFYPAQVMRLFGSSLWSKCQSHPAEKM